MVIQFNSSRPGPQIFQYYTNTMNMNALDSIVIATKY